MYEGAISLEGEGLLMSAVGIEPVPTTLLQYTHRSCQAMVPVGAMVTAPLGGVWGGGAAAGESLGLRAGLGLAGTSKFRRMLDDANWGEGETRGATLVTMPAAAAPVAPTSTCCLLSPRPFTLPSTRLRLGCGLEGGLLSMPLLLLLLLLLLDE